MSQMALVSRCCTVENRGQYVADRSATCPEIGIAEHKRDMISMASLEFIGSLI